MERIPVIHFGLGPIGQSIARLVAEEDQLESIGAVDVDPTVVGRQLPEICDALLPDLTVVNELSELSAPTGSVILQATVSTLEAARYQLLEAIARGYHVVSTCEELAWPWDEHASLAAEIDMAAKKSEVTILATGINPGFIMDTLPLFVSRVAGGVEAIHVSRIVDLGERRLPLQRKMGVGQDPAQVQELLDEERIGHVGLTTSLHMLAAGLGWHLDVIDLVNNPIVAQSLTETGLGLVPAGKVIGVRQQAMGIVAGTPRLILNLVMEIDTEGGTRDEIHIDGEQCIRLRLDGIQGDIATAALIVSQALQVRQLQPGLHTMLSAPLLPRV